MDEVVEDSVPTAANDKEAVVEARLSIVPDSAVTFCTPSCWIDAVEDERVPTTVLLDWRSAMDAVVELR
jgi:hypothetical protein